MQLTPAPMTHEYHRRGRAGDESNDADSVLTPMLRTPMRRCRLGAEAEVDDVLTPCPYDD